MRKKLQTTWKHLRWAGSYYYFGFKDMWLTLLCFLKRENAIGRYVDIMTESERELFFMSDSSAGGICYKTMIKLFLCKQYFLNDKLAEDVTCDIIEHETLHMTLRNRIGFQAYKKLDDVHKPFFVNDRWILDWVGGAGGRLHQRKD